MRTFVDPMYASADCMLSIVNTTAPDHYKAHPFWKDLSYDNTCEGNEAMKEFLFSQIKGKVSETEFFLFSNFNRFFFLAAVAATVNSVYRNGFLNLIHNARVNLLSCFFSRTFMLMFIHFADDNTYITGSILHHADTSRWSDKQYLHTGTIPRGFIMTYCWNFMWLMFAVKIMFDCDPINILRKKNFLPTLSQIFFSFMLFNFNKEHPLYHELAQPNGIKALPFSLKYKAYKHVFVHHHDGDSFGSSAALDGFFSKCFYLFSELHNDCLGGLGGITSTNHYLFVIGFDALMGVTILLIIYGMFTGAAWIFENVEGSYAPKIKRVFTVVFTLASLFFFVLLLNKLEDANGNFRWPFGFLDLEECAESCIA